MPFSSVLGASTVIKPGVCTSTTRPTTPYDGQVIYETDTDRVAVWEGSSWNYKTGAEMATMVTPTSIAGTGVTLSGGKVSFSASSSISVNGCFSSAYTNYKLIVNAKGGATSEAVRIRFRANGVDTSSAYYTHAVYTTHTAGPSRNYNAGEAQGYIGWSADISYNINVEVHNPFQSDYTSWTSTSNGIGSGTATVGTLWGMQYTTTTFDGFNLSPTSGTLTGSVRIYGYRENI
jgi:hypothetical protein